MQWRKKSAEHHAYLGSPPKSSQLLATKAWKDSHSQCLSPHLHGQPSARREGGKEEVSLPSLTLVLYLLTPPLQASAQAPHPQSLYAEHPPCTSLGFPASRPRPGQAWNPLITLSKQAGHESLCPVAGALSKARAPGFSLGLPPASKEARPAC